MGLLGPSRKEVWSGIAEEIGAEFKSGFLGAHEIHYDCPPWKILLDKETLSGHGSGFSTSPVSRSYTRGRVLFVSGQDAIFDLHRKGWLEKLTGFLSDEVKTGHEDFDECYQLLAQQETLARRLFANRQIRSLLDRQSNFLSLSIETVDPPYPEDCRLLASRSKRDKSPNNLKALLELFPRVLESLVALGIAENRPATGRLV